MPEATTEAQPEDYGVEPGALTLMGVEALADPSGALFLPVEQVLIVADLHLEKGSSFARRGVLLPPYDTATTLLFLARAVARWRPRLIVALGDSFHDVEGPARLDAQNRENLRDLQAGRDWIWALGNHDSSIPADMGGEVVGEMTLGPLTLRHEPQAGAPGEIAGHLHPAARVVGASGSTRRRCFLADAQRCILPAFGAYAGGLNVHDPAFAPLFPAGGQQAHVLGRAKIFRVGLEQCAPEAQKTGRNETFGRARP